MCITGPDYYGPPENSACTSILTTKRRLVATTKTGRPPGLLRSVFFCLHASFMLLTSHTKLCRAFLLSAQTPNTRTGRERNPGLKSCESSFRSPARIPAEADVCGKMQAQKPSGTGRPSFTSATYLLGGRRVRKRGSVARGKG